MDINAFIKTYGMGLTGGIASGKSTVAAMIKRRGYEVIDADALARQAVVPGSPGLAKVVTTFGSQVLRADASLDRKLLGQLVFADPQKKQQLEAILHPAIASLLEAHLRDSGMLTQAKPWFYEAALLVETGGFRRFRSLWLTTCPADLQLARLMQRNHLSAEQASSLIAQQLPDASKRAHADVIIDTGRSLGEVATQVNTALDALAAGTG